VLDAEVIELMIRNGTCLVPNSVPAEFRLPAGVMHPGTG